MAQEEAEHVIYNSISTNLMLPIFESFDLSYERSIANKWAIGLAGAVYGERVSDLSTDYNRDLKTKFEIMPFGRVYFQGAQNNSHFVELFGSLSKLEEHNRYIRSIKDDGYAVYRIGVKDYMVGGLGAGYGYRLLLLEKRLLLEAQIGLRTNFNADFIFLNVTAIRTGIKIGYRF